MKPTKTISVVLWAALGACAPGSFQVAASGTHVTFSPAGIVNVRDGQTQSFTVTPEANNTIVSAVTGSCPAGSWNGDVYTTGKITASCEVGFSAAPVTFPVSADAMNVTVLPGGTQTVAVGTSEAFTVRPDFGYTTLSTVGGTCPSGTWSGAVYTTGPVKGACTVIFSATVDSHQVTTSGDSLETITPSAPQTVGDGATPAFTVTGHTGDTLSSTVGGTCPAGAWVGAVYTTGPIASDCTLTFSAAVSTFHVTASGDSLETIAPSTPQTVSYRGTLALTVTPDAHDVVAATVGGTCPAGTWNGAVYTTGAITADCTVSFTGLPTYQVTPSGDSNETIAPSVAQTVGSGLTQAFTVMGNHDQEVSAQVGGTCPAGTWTGAVYTTGAITADCTVAFSATPVVVVTASSDTNVSVGPSGTLALPPGSTLAFTVTPMAGMAASVVPGGTCPAGYWTGAVYTTGTIAADCSIVFTGVTPVFQPAPWTSDSGGSVATVAGATDTEQITFTFSATAAAMQTAQSIATTDEIVFFSWNFAGSYDPLWGVLKAFSSGPEGQSTVTLVPDSNTNPNGVSGTGTLTLRAGYAFGFNCDGSAEPDPAGGLTVSTVWDVPDFHVSASGDSNETVAPAGAVVREGTTLPLTVTPDAGESVSSSVGGSCPSGTWDGTEYSPGSVTMDCSLVFSGSRGTGESDAGSGLDGGSNHSGGVFPNIVSPNVHLDTDPVFYTALDWAARVWPSGTPQSGPANLSISDTWGTLTFDSPPSLDLSTGDLTFATTPGTSGTATVLVTLPETGQSDGGTNTAMFSITVNTPPTAVDITQSYPWRSPCIPVTLQVDDPDINDQLSYEIDSVPTNGFLQGLQPGWNELVPEYQFGDNFESTFCYVPFSSTWTGSDTFTFNARDDHGGVAATSGTVSIQVFEN